VDLYSNAVRKHALDMAQARLIHLATAKTTIDVCPAIVAGKDTNATHPKSTAPAGTNQ
jgi:hypothetical protein